MPRALKCPSGDVGGAVLSRLPAEILPEYLAECTIYTRRLFLLFSIASHFSVDVSDSYPIAISWGQRRTLLRFTLLVFSTRAPKGEPLPAGGSTPPLRMDKHFLNRSFLLVENSSRKSDAFAEKIAKLNNGGVHSTICCHPRKPSTAYIDKPLQLPVVRDSQQSRRPSPGVSPGAPSPPPERSPAPPASDHVRSRNVTYMHTFVCTLAQSFSHARLLDPQRTNT